MDGGSEVRVLCSASCYCSWWTGIWTLAADSTDGVAEPWDYGSVVYGHCSGYHGDAVGEGEDHGPESSRWRSLERFDA